MLMIGPRTIVESFSEALDEMYHSPFMGFDGEFAKLHIAMTADFKCIKSAMRICDANPDMKEIVHAEMEKCLVRALMSFGKCTILELTIPEVKRLPEFHEFIEAFAGAAEIAQDVHHQFLWKYDVHVGDRSRAVVYTAIANDFSKNLKEVLKDLGMTLDEFINRGPLPTSRKARAIVEADELPSLPTARFIAKFLGIDVERLLKNIPKPELLNTSTTV